MSIIIVTGQPGSGKTAMAVDMIAHDPQFKGRPLFVMGVPDLAIDHQPCPPVSEWTEYRKSPEDETINLAYFTFPENALVLVDEAQRVYRPRSVGSKVPPEVAAFETHRHTGIDFILITQHVGLIDSNIRKLVGRHIHIRVTPLGRYKYQWTEIGDPESASSREIAAKERYSPPKRVFDLYKSSQLHTKIKVKLPLFVYVFVIAFILFIALGVYAYKRIVAKTESPVVSESVNKPSQINSADNEKKQIVANSSDYLSSAVPRIPGMFHTAPKYDQITQPKDAPWPSLCIDVSKSGSNQAHCRCLDQQGNNYATTYDLCRHIAQNGIFKDWGELKEKEKENKPDYQRQEKPDNNPNRLAQAPI